MLRRIKAKILRNGKRKEGRKEKRHEKYNRKGRIPIQKKATKKNSQKKSKGKKLKSTRGMRERKSIRRKGKGKQKKQNVFGSKKRSKMSKLNNPVDVGKDYNNENHNASYDYDIIEDKLLDAFLQQ